MTEQRPDKKSSEIPEVAGRATLKQPRIGINQMDMGGWVRVYLGQGEPNGELAPFLSHALNGWFRERPHLRLRFVLPVTRNGNTVELHGWYEQIWFSDQSPMAKAAPRTPGAQAS